MDDPNRARIEANVQKMIAAKAPPEDVEAYLQSEGLRPNQPSSEPQMPRSSTPEPEQVESAGQAIAGGLSGGLSMLPGGQALMAGIIKATSGDKFLGLGGKKLSYDDALKLLESSQEASPAFLRRASKAAGVVGSMGLTPLKVIQGGRLAGAAFGGGAAAAQRLAEAAPESAGTRALGTLGAGAMGAGIGYSAPWLLANPITRTALGAAGGGAAGWSIAPEGHKLSGALGGATAGGALVASPSTTTGLVAKATQKVSPKLAEMMESFSQASGLKGLVNREMKGRQDIADATRTGAIVGARGGGAKALVGAQNAQKTVAGQQFEQSMDEGEQAFAKWQQDRGDVIDENVRRMLEQFRIESQEALEALSPTTAQSATGASRKGQSVRDAIESLRAASAEAVRRRGPVGATSPFAGQSPRAQNVVQQQRGAMFDREAMGVRPSELGRTAGAGEPQFVDPELTQTISGVGQRSTLTSPYRPETTQAGIEEMREQAAGIPSRFKVTVPKSGEPQLQFPDETQMVVRRSAANTVRPTPQGPRLNETPTQTAAREALERRAAYESLPASVRQAPKPEVPGQLPVPDEVHPAVSSMYQNPLVEQAAAHVRKLGRYRAMAPDDPRFVDEVFKTLSDQKMMFGKRIEGATGPVNFVRASRQELQDAQDEILRAADQMMPTYRNAVTEFARSEAMKRAFMRGYNAVRGTMTAKGMLKTSPEAFENWVARQKPDVAQTARQGARYGVADAAAGVELNKGRAGLFGVAPFRQQADDVARRKATGLPELERTWSRVMEDASRETPRQMRVWLPGTAGHAYATLINSIFTPPLERAAAQKILNEVLADPRAYQAIIKKYSTGKAMTDKLMQLFSTQLGMSAGR